MTAQKTIALKKNALEWAVLAVSALLVAWTVGFLIHDAVHRPDGPPDLRLELGRPQRVGSLYRVPVTVENVGGETAADAIVEVVLALPDGASEHAEVEVAHVPRGSRREGWVTFGRDPAAGRLSGRVVGFEQP